MRFSHTRSGEPRTIEAHPHPRRELHGAAPDFQWPRDKRCLLAQEPIHFTGIGDGAARDARLHPAAEVTCDTIAEHGLHPEIAEWTLVEGYGKVLGRPGSPGTDKRELAAVGALIALDVGRQLAAHLRGSLHVGVPGPVLASAARNVAAEWGRKELVEPLLAELGLGQPA